MGLIWGPSGATGPGPMNFAVLDVEWYIRIHKWYQSSRFRTAKCCKVFIIVCFFQTRTHSSHMCRTSSNQMAKAIFFLISWQIRCHSMCNGKHVLIINMVCCDISVKFDAWVRNFQRNSSSSSIDWLISYTEVEADGPNTFRYYNDVIWALLGETISH